MVEKMTENSIEVLDINDFLKSDKKGDNIINSEKIINTLLDETRIDSITRIRDLELDKISTMLHHTIQISAKYSAAMLMYSENRDIYIKENKLFICSGYKYIKQNLKLRLSINSRSREEFENIFTTFFKHQIEKDKNIRMQNDPNNQIRQN